MKIYTLIVALFGGSLLAAPGDCRAESPSTVGEAKIDDALANAPAPALPRRRYRYSELPETVAKSGLMAADNMPKDNPVTDAGATLGRVLFYDRHMSKNNTISCGSCHQQKHGFSDPLQFSEGFLGGHTRRNSMGIVNARFTHVHGTKPGFFWDERAPRLEDQVLMPIQDAVEMGMKLSDLEKKLAKVPYLPPLFEKAFGSPEVTSDRIAKSVAQFMRSMVSVTSKYDIAAAEAVKKGVDLKSDFPGFTAEENLGKSLFVKGAGHVGEFGCARCHMPPSFAMPKSFNNGLDLNYSDRGLGERDVPSNDPLTQNNDGKFKAAPLRNVALTAPYMHDGRFRTIDEVVDHYSEGVLPHDNVALAIDEEETDGSASGIHLSSFQKRALVAFLRTLTDEPFINDPRFSDPFKHRP